ncbi:MAG: Rrf2 family transcriptional regulator [Bdellovibrionales bacterium]|nr:Rrf2 family transcriptional regulator [Bdellovibrionales bacterium]
MVKLNRTTEYGLIALRYMMGKQSQGDASVTSARELADRYDLPFEITAKTLQRMKESGLIQSAHGARGGYTIARCPSKLNLAEFLELMEGPQAVVGCTSPALAVSGGAPSPCEYKGKCEVKGVMTDLNSRVKTFLAGILLTDLAEFKSPNSTPNVSKKDEMQTSSKEAV